MSKLEDALKRGAKVVGSSDMGDPFANYESDRSGKPIRSIAFVRVTQDVMDVEVNFFRWFRIAYDGERWQINAFDAERLSYDGSTFNKRLERSFVDLLDAQIYLLGELRNRKPNGEYLLGNDV